MFLHNGLQLIWVLFGLFLYSDFHQKGPLGVIGEDLFGLVCLSACLNIRMTPVSSMLLLFTQMLAGITVPSEIFLTLSECEMDRKDQGHRPYACVRIVQRGSLHLFYFLWSNFFFNGNSQTPRVSSSTFFPNWLIVRPIDPSMACRVIANRFHRCKENLWHFRLMPLLWRNLMNWEAILRRFWMCDSVLISLPRNLDKIFFSKCLRTCENIEWMSFLFIFTYSCMFSPLPILSSLYTLPLSEPLILLPAMLV